MKHHRVEHLENQKKNTTEEGKIPWLRSGEVSKGKILETELFITKEGLKNSSAKIFPKNTIVIAMYGATAGQVGILKMIIIPRGDTNSYFRQCNNPKCKHRTDVKEYTEEVDKGI